MVIRHKPKTDTAALSLRIILFCTVLIFTVLAVVFIPRGSGLYMYSSNRHVPSVQPEGNAYSERLDAEKFIRMLDDELYSEYAYLCTAGTCSVIAEKNSGEKYFPASLTKIMTAMVLIENADSLDAQVTVPPDIYNELYRQGASMAGFLPNEKVTLRDLLYGIMLPSGAEAALAAAEFVAGGEKELVAMMNSKAEQMGLANTHFANITGLHDENHYTNVCELAQILACAVENETFLEISSAREYYVAPTNKHPDGFTMKSTVFEKLGGKQPENATIMGGKTGFTYEAGLCLATYAVRDGKTYIAVTLGAEGNHRTAQHQVDDALYLYNLVA